MTQEKPPNDKCECFLEITDSERAARWKGVFEHDWIPIRSPILTGIAKVGKEEFAFFEMDMQRVSGQQELMIGERAAKAFGLLTVPALREDDKRGMPVIIKGEDVIVHWCELHTRIAMSMSDDEESEDYEDDYEGDIDSERGYDGF